MADNPDGSNFPLHVFRFNVQFLKTTLKTEEGSGKEEICGGRFSECTGLEATMEPKVINAGGRNYGPAQRAGPVTFATVILRRGITQNDDLWQWWSLVTQQHKYAYRLNAEVTLLDHSGGDIMKWTLANAMPTKFKAPDMNSTANEVGIEELHFVHEGLTFEMLKK